MIIISGGCSPALSRASAHTSMRMFATMLDYETFVSGRRHLPSGHGEKESIAESNSQVHDSCQAHYNSQQWQPIEWLWAEGWHRRETSFDPLCTVTLMQPFESIAAPTPQSCFKIWTHSHYGPSSCVFSLSHERSQSLRPIIDAHHIGNTPGARCSSGKGQGLMQRMASAGAAQTFVLIIQNSWCCTTAVASLTLDELEPEISEHRPWSSGRT